MGMEEGSFTLHSYSATGISRWSLLQDSYFQSGIHPKFSKIILAMKDLMYD